jgi:hypothetical protein
MILKILVILLISFALSVFAQDIEVYAVTYDPLGLIKSNYQFTCGIFDPCSNKIIQLFPFIPFNWNLGTVHSGNLGISSLDKNIDSYQKSPPMILPDIPFP